MRRQTVNDKNDNYEDSCIADLQCSDDDDDALNDNEDNNDNNGENKILPRLRCTRL